MKDMKIDEIQDHLDTHGGYCEDGEDLSDAFRRIVAMLEAMEREIAQLEREKGEGGAE